MATKKVETRGHVKKKRATASQGSTGDRGKKFRELLLYVARKTEADPRCGSVKLNKILFYCDFEAYRRFGRAITGEEYQKLEYGPAPRRLLPQIEEMEREGVCAWADREYFGFHLKKLLPLREPDLSLFTGEEIDIVNTVIDSLWDLNATEVSDLSHRFVGWQVVDPGETIPYETVFVGPPRPLTDQETVWAHEVMREYGEQGPAKGRPNSTL